MCFVGINLLYEIKHPLFNTCSTDYPQIMQSPHISDSYSLHDLANGLVSLSRWQDGHTINCINN